MSLSQHLLQQANADQLYVRLLHDLLQNGERSAPRGRAIREKRPMVLRIPDARLGFVQDPTRKLSPGLMVVEPFQMVWGISVPDMLGAVAPNYKQFVNPATGQMDGAYPPRIAAQLPYMLDLLKRDPDTRQAVLSIYGPQDQHESRDVPCTETLQFFVRDSKLELLVNMRSSDAWLGIPYDFAQFTLLQLAVASDLEIEPGQFTLTAGSSHIYERDVERIERFLGDSTWDFDTRPTPYPEQLPMAESQRQAEAALRGWWEGGVPFTRLEGVFADGYGYLCSRYSEGRALVDAVPGATRQL